MRSAMRMVLVLTVQVMLTGTVPAQKAPGDNPNPLRADKALQVALQLEGQQKLHGFLGKLREATGLDITVDPSLQELDPDLGHFQASKRGYRAWQVMDLIAKRDIPGGYWEKIDGGYRLRSSSLSDDPKTPAEPARQPRGVGLTTWLLLIIASLLIVVLVLVFLLWKASRRNVRVRAKLT